MSNNLTKRDIILEIRRMRTELQLDEARNLVQSVLSMIYNALVDGKKVELRNFGVFETQIRKPKIGRNPNKPEKDVLIPERIVVKFKAGKELKAALKKSGSTLKSQKS